MNKNELILKMLSFHHQIKSGDDERNSIVLEVWLEDLGPFGVEEINQAWKRTRARAKFFSLAELMEDLLSVHDFCLNQRSSKEAWQIIDWKSGQGSLDGLDEIAMKQTEHPMLSMVEDISSRESVQRLADMIAEEISKERDELISCRLDALKLNDVQEHPHLPQKSIQGVRMYTPKKRGR